MKFAMYMIAEYANMTATTCIATILFFGGWNGPMFGPAWLQMVLPTLWFVLKIAVFIFFTCWRARRFREFRYDQLMRFGWKYLLAGLAGQHSGDQFHGGDFMIQVLFFLFAALAIGAAINVLVQKHVLYSALSLIVMLTAVSVLFVFLQADFLAVIQVIVYAGAIMVLFVFVIMLFNLPPDEEGVDRLRWLKFLGIPMGLFLLFLIVATLWNVEPVRPERPHVGQPASDR